MSRPIGIRRRLTEYRRNVTERTQGTGEGKAVTA
jgi:hypothetical protein